MTAGSHLSPPHDTSSRKQILRKEVLTRRDSLSAVARQTKSARVAQSLVDYLLAHHMVSLRLSAYWPIRSEVDLRGSYDALASGGATLSLPVVLDRETIIFRRYCPGDVLESGGFGTLAPPANAAVVDPDVLIMPVAGFDATGARLGYGAGHYDRAIARLKAKGRTVVTIGVAFEVQKCTAIPTEPHDWPLDAVITETESHIFSERITAP